jgi:hypothetical protein
MRSRPHKDPIRELKDETLRRALPDPRLEVEALDELEAVLRAHGGPSAGTLREVKAWVEGALKKSAPDYVRVLSPFPRDAPAEAAGPRPTEVTPFVVRFLQVERGPWLLARHLLALDALGPAPRWRERTTHELGNALAGWSLVELRGFFAEPAVARTRDELADFVDAPGIPLRAFFKRLAQDWGARAEPFGLVLVLDQFEELFTRFVDQKHRGAAKDDTLPDWRLRGAYFAELAELLATPLAEPALPVRAMLSMRSDYIGQLGELEALAGPIPLPARYHLRVLRLADLDTVVTAPAKRFGVGFEPAILADLHKQLPSYEDSIEPGHVQIICERLWDGQGAALAAEGGGTIAAVTLKGLGGVFGILEQHFRRLLEGRGNPFDRFDILDLLEPLINQGRSRNIVAKRLLLDARYRRVTEHELLLERLRNQRFIRIEHRLGDEFAEVSHEFLIAPINDEIARALIEEPRWRNLKGALESLRRLEEQGFRDPRQHLLWRHEVDALVWYKRRLDLAQHPWIHEVIFRAALRNGAAPRALRRLADALDKAAVQVDPLQELRRRAASRNWLSGMEIRELCRAADLPALPSAELEFLLRSGIERLGQGDQALIAAITRSLLDARDRP